MNKNELIAAVACSVAVTTQNGVAVIGTFIVASIETVSTKCFGVADLLVEGIKRLGAIAAGLFVFLLSTDAEKSASKATFGAQATSLKSNRLARALPQSIARIAGLKGFEFLNRTYLAGDLRCGRNATC